MTWKNNGEFEVCNSIAAACDRIAERTGMVISRADISHALLKERVYNADAFCVRYANAQTDTDPASPEGYAVASEHGQTQVDAGTDVAGTANLNGPDGRDGLDGQRVNRGDGELPMTELKLEEKVGA